MLKFGSGIHVGKTRHGKKNQDAICIVNRISQMPLLVLADGMGGYQGGEIASRVVLSTLKKAYRHRKKQTPIVDVLSFAILKAYQQIVKKAGSNENLAKMGSTVVAVAIDKKRNEIHVANVGDSRAYLITKDEIKVISYDHSEVAELRRSGVLTDEEALTYFRKNVLTMSLSSGRPESSVKPFTDSLDFPEDAVVLLCSDGLWGPVSETLIHLAALEYEPQKAADKLIQMANLNGGPDNISVLIARRSGEWQKYKNEHSRDMDDTG